MTAIYGGWVEDEAMVGVGASVVTTAGSFDSTMSRCSVSIPASSSDAQFQFTQNQLAYSQSVFWQSNKVNSSVAGQVGTKNSNIVTMAWADASGINRLILKNNASSGNNMGIYKINAAGTATQLGSSFQFSLAGGSTIDKIDTDINYAVSGHVNFYVNGTLLLTYSGDITTDSVTTLAYSRMGAANAGSSGATRWSQGFISDSDTRTWVEWTGAPVANGNTHNFDTGTPAASNVNEITRDNSTYDGSTTAGQIDQYTIPSLPSGYAIVSWGVSAAIAKGASGPSKMDLGVRSGGSDYWSSDQTLTAALLNYQNWWSTDPNTSAAWTAAPTNIGLKSVT